MSTPTEKIPATSIDFSFLNSQDSALSSGVTGSEQKLKASSIDFSNLDEDPQPKSMVSRALSMIHNFDTLNKMVTTGGIGVDPVEAGNFLGAMSNRSGLKEATLEALGDFYQFVRNKALPTLMIAQGDLPISDATGKKILSAAKGAVTGAGQQLGNPVDAAVGLGMAMASPVTDVLQLATGVNIEGETGQYSPLSVDEQKHKIKNVVSMAAAMAVTGGLSSAGGPLSSELAGVTGKETTGELISRIKTPTPTLGKLGKDLLIKGTAKGALFGAVQAGVAGANEDDQLTNVLINGVLFAPLGTAIELVGRGGEARAIQDREVLNKRKAYEIASTRQAKNVYDNTMGGVLSNLQGMKGAENIFDAVLKGGIDLDAAPILVAHVPAEEVNARLAEVKQHLDSQGGVKYGDVIRSSGVEIPVADDADATTTKSVVKGMYPYATDFNIVEHGGERTLQYNLREITFQDRLAVMASTKKNDAGMHTLLITTNDIFKHIDTDFFATTGFVKDGIVSHEGKEYVLTGYKNDFSEKLKANNEKTGPYGLPKYVKGINENIIADNPVDTNLATIRDPFTLAEKQVPISEIRHTNAVKSEFMIQRVYHGTARVYDMPDLANAQGGLYGKGFYTTESAKVAGEYTTKDASSQLQMYQRELSIVNNSIAEWQANFDRDPKAEGIEQVKAQLDILKSNKVKIEDQIAKHSATHAANVRVHSLDIKNPLNIDAQVPRAEAERVFKILGIQDEPSFMSGEDLYRAIENHAYNEDEVAGLMKKAGYDGITHIGGDRMGGGYNHRVWIAFDESQIHPAKWGVPSNHEVGGEFIVKREKGEAYDDFYKRVYTHPELENYPGVEFVDGNTAKLVRGYKENLNTQRDLVTNPIRGITEHTQRDLSEALDHTYQEIKSLYLTPNVEHPSDYTPTDPSWNFETIIRKYAEEKGVSAREYPSFRDAISKRLVNDLGGRLETEDKSLIKAATKSMFEQSVVRRQTDAFTLQTLANNNGFFIDIEDAGGIAIRDIESGKKLFSTRKFDEAQAFIDKTGQASDYNIGNGGGDLPPIASNLFDAPNYSNEPVSFFRQGKAAALVDWFRLHAPYITRNREIFVALDNKFGLGLLPTVFDKLQDGAIRRNAAMKPHYEWLSEVADEYQSIPKDRRQIVFGYMETMSPDEVIAHGAANRKMTPFEVEVAKTIVGNDVDLSKVFKARIALRDAYDAWSAIKDEVKKNGATSESAELFRAYRAKRDEVFSNLDLTEAEQKTIDSFYDIDEMSKNQATIGMITRLARAMSNGEMTQPEYAKFHGMSKKELALAAKLRGKYAELATVFGIEPSQMLGNYTTHARLYSSDGRELQSTFDNFGPSKAKDFYARMSRTGEIESYELDPIEAMRRYIKAGFDTIHLSELVADAKNSARESINAAIKDGRFTGSSGEQANKLVQTYIDDIQGHVDKGRTFSASVWEAINKKFGYNFSPDTNREIINVLSSTGEAAAQGARVTAALRDLSSSLIISNMRFGVGETANILKAGLAAMKDGTAKELQQIGAIPESGIVHFADATDYEASKLKKTRGKISKGLDSTNQLLFRLSGQKDIYTMFHAGHYIRSMERFSEAAKDLKDGRINLEEFGRRTYLHKADMPVVQEVLRLLPTEPEEAAKFLARNTGQEMMGVYGFANHPSGWNSNIGRVAGQFGQWSAWFQGTLLRETTRGTLGDRSASMVRLMAGQKLMVGLGAAYGLNLTRWQPTAGMLFGGGPAIGIYDAIVNATQGAGYQQEQGIRSLSNLLPHNDKTIGQIYLPGSFFVQDLYNSLALQAQNDPRWLARAGGIPVITPRSMFYEYNGIPVGGVERRALEATGNKSKLRTK